MPWIHLVVALVAGTIFWFAFGGSAPPRSVAIQEGFTRLDPPLPLPEFELISGASGNLTNADLRGKWTVISLGFTSCPDICPNTLSNLSRALPALDAAGVEARVLFVSVDPERDTVQRLGEYAAHFGPGVESATGSHDALRQLIQPLGLFYRKAPHSGSGAYTVEHSTTVLVVNPRGEVEGLLSGDPLSAGMVAGAIRTLDGVSA